MSPRRAKTQRIRPTRVAAPVVKIPSTDPAARDEGPRLIPLPEGLQPVPGTRRHLELADKLLGQVRRKPR
jgi:hypothetical protein